MKPRAVVVARLRWRSHQGHTIPGPVFPYRRFRTEYQAGGVTNYLNNSPFPSYLVIALGAVLRCLLSTIVFGRDPPPHRHHPS